MQDSRKLLVWQKSHALTLEAYRVSSDFPRSEAFGLTSQLRRSVSSVPTNIAEGCGRGTDADFARFLQIAMGSACETEYHFILARDLHFLTPENYEVVSKQIEEVKRMLASLIQKLKAER